MLVQDLIAAGSKFRVTCAFANGSGSAVCSTLQAESDRQSSSAAMGSAASARAAARPEGSDRSGSGRSPQRCGDSGEAGGVLLYPNRPV